MTTKKTEQKAADKAPDKAPGKVQDAPNIAVQPNPPVEVPVESHYLGTDALTGEPGEHGAVLETDPDLEDPEADREDDTDEYYQNTWNGHPSYQCKRCQFNTLDRDLFMEHWNATHAARPAAPPEVVLPKFDRFGNYVPPESK